MRRVFLTGATGTIGSALLPQLLSDPATEATLLVRASDDADLQRRLDGMLMYWNFAAGGQQALRIRAVRGDIALPDFGMDAAVRSQLVACTTHIIHCAASVNLNMPLDHARATAVAPTRTIVEMARLGLHGGQLQKVDLVSTVGVWGRTPGLMPERRLPEVTDFHNTYEAAKSEAERVVWAEAHDLPITVHRPSMVVGETGNGRVVHFQVFYHLCEFLSGARTFGVMPKLGGTRLDTIPVDWVAKAIDWSSRSPQSVGRILHLCSGPDAALPLTELQPIVRRLWAQAGKPLPALRTIDRRWLERMVPLIGLLAGAKVRRSLRALPPVLAYLAEQQGFRNTETTATLAAAGLPLPQPRAYIDTVLRYYLDQPGAPDRGRR